MTAALDPERQAPAVQAWWDSLTEDEQQTARDRVEGKDTIEQLWLAARVHNTEHCLSDIAILAYRLEREMFFAPRPDAEDDEDDAERHELLFGRLRDAINLMGYLADLGCAQLAGGTSPMCVKEGATDWLTAPVFDRKAGVAVEARARARET